MTTFESRLERVQRNCDSNFNEIGLEEPTIISYIIITLRKLIIILVVRLIFLNILCLTKFSLREGNWVYNIIDIPITFVSFEIDLSHVVK